MVIRTDAATSTRIGAALVIDVNTFSASKEFDMLWAETAGPSRGGTVASTALIYGFAMLAILAIVFASADFLRGAWHFISTTLTVRAP